MYIDFIWNYFIGVLIELLPSTSTAGTTFAITGITGHTEGSSLTVSNEVYFSNATTHKPVDVDSSVRLKLISL